MSKKEVLIYIGGNSKRNKKLLEQLDDWEIDYKKKNVIENPKFMKELQDKGIFATPATFIDGDPILGLQLNKIKHALEIRNTGFGNND
ncbi:NrdH-redoxin [Virgibacillus ndiopensis]|uniref:NrdH-redoxin n=1 Tax=Virgibacillus ndiopensis TaxID=2004408 RepID=UPI000C07EEAC|nr:NrdH-redoxin [Virgibacillus ndiopensis]